MNNKATPTKEALHIGDLAEATGLSLRTIRHYDEIGLLRASGRSEGGFRLYTQSDLDRLIVIRRMKPLGFSLEQMADLLALVDALQEDPSAASVREKLGAYLEEAQERRDRLERHLSMADEFISLLRSR